MSNTGDVRQTGSLRSVDAGRPRRSRETREGLEGLGGGKAGPVQGAAGYLQFEMHPADEGTDAKYAGNSVVVV